MAADDGSQIIELLNNGDSFKVCHLPTSYCGNYAYDSYLNPDIKLRFIQPPNLTRFLLYYNALETEEEQFRLRSLPITQHRNLEARHIWKAYLACFDEILNLRLTNGGSVKMSVDKCQDDKCWHCWHGTGIYSFTHPGPWKCRSLSKIAGQPSPLLQHHTYQQYLDVCDNCFIGMLGPHYTPCDHCMNIHRAIKALADREPKPAYRDPLPYIPDVVQFFNNSTARREFAAQIAERQSRLAPELHTSRMS